MSSGLNIDRAVVKRQTERYSVISTDDPCEHAASLRGWSQDYLQLSTGFFAGEIVETSIGPVQIFRESIHQRVDEEAIPRCNSYTVGVPVWVEDDGYWQGRLLECDSLITLRPNEELHFRTPKDSSIVVAVIDSASFEAFAEDAAGVDVKSLIARSNTEILPANMAMQVRIVLNEVLTSMISAPETFEHEASVRAVVETVMSASLNGLVARSSLKESPRNAHSVQRAIVERARNYILENRENPLTVTELSSYLRMSRRGLHHAFINVLGINIVTFLRYVRLHGVRKELLRASASDSVSRIAGKWGFWHMSMFSSYYKALFGESPSSTLRKISRTFS